MTVLTAGGNTPIQMDDVFFLFTGLLGGEPQGAPTATTFTIRNVVTGELFAFTGTGFGSFVDNVPTTGTITGLTYSVGGVVTATFSNASVPVANMILALATGDSTAFFNGIFGGDDTITGSNFEWQFGGFGDVLVGYGGNDTITGGAGDDDLYGDASPSPSYAGGGFGNDHLSGGAGNDLIDGGAGNDTMLGGDGDDSIRATAGNDVIDGGAGNDHLLLDRSTVATAFVFDLAAFSYDTFALGETTISNIERYTFNTGTGNDTFTLTAPIVDVSLSFNGGGGVDTLSIDLSGFVTSLVISGAWNSLTFDGAGGIGFASIELFHIQGGGGDDNLEGGALNDTLNGGAGNDTLFGNGGTNQLSGGVGEDSFFHNSGTSIDHIDGGGGIDTLSLNLSSLNGVTLTTASLATGATLANGTTITGIERLGNSIFGAGADTFNVTDGALAGTAYDGGGGHDHFILNLSSRTTGVWLENSIYGYTNLDVVVSLTAFEQFTVTSGSGNDLLDGAGGNDVLTANAGDDSLRGFEGDDRLVGGNGIDLLFGGGGNDIISGGSGNDQIRGEAGNDIINAGEGNDYVWYDGQGVDTIDAGAGDSDVVSVDLSAVTTDLALSHAVLAGGWTLSNGTKILNAEYLGSVLLGSGDDTLTLTGAYVRGDEYRGGAGFDTLVLVANLHLGVQFGRDGDASYISSFSIMAATIHDFERLDLTFGSGDDSVQGGLGNDTIRGEGGADLINGREGDDTVFGGVGNDSLEGGEGVDLLYGGGGDDTLFLSEGDTLDGGAGSDIVYIDVSDSQSDFALSPLAFATGAGSTFNGALVRNVERFHIRTGSGDDTLTASLATSGTFDAGAGLDRFFADLSSATESITLIGGAPGGPEPPWFGLHSSSYNFSITLLGVDEVHVTGGTWYDQMAGAWGDDVLNGGGGDDEIAGGAGDDTLSGGANNDTVSGDEGNDTLSGDDGIDLLSGGAGDDNLDGGAGADTLDGESGADTASYASATTGVTIRLFNNVHAGAYAIGDVLLSIENVRGSAFADSLLGSDTANLLDGDAANDYLNGLGGADTLLGGAGNDRLIGDVGDDVLDGGLGADTLDGGAGADGASYAGSDAAVTVKIWSQTVTGGHAQGDRLINIENAIGSAFGDTLIGSDGAANQLDGGGGNDYLNGLSGDDRLDGGDGVDRLIGGVGADTLEGGAGADSIDGGADNDTVSYSRSNAAVTVKLWNQTATGGHAQGDRLISIEHATGSAFDDVIVGSDSAANTLRGGNGGDVLYGLSGNDALFGDGGDDRLDGGLGADGLNGGDGLDIADYAGSSAAVTVRLYNGVATGGSAEGDSFVSIEGVNGSAFADSLYGSLDIGDRLSGGEGNDTLSGLSGDDTLIGGGGADRLVGDVGDDTLDGGGSGDMLEGGAGSDTASYASSTAGVTVKLWNGAGAGGQAQGDKYTSVENVIGSAYADSLVGADAIANRLDGGAGADYLNGLSGNDTLIGGLGADTLVGGAGGDTFVFNAALGPGNIDVVSDFDVAVDRIYLESAIFSALTEGPLSYWAFRAEPTAFGLQDHILYDPATGALLYDADGAGGGGAVQFARLAPLLNLTYEHIVVI